MAISNYLPPVDKLLVLGDPRKEREWRDYLKLGFTAEHAAELIQMALDENLRWADSESKEVWANLHAWRTLGQLRAQSAVGPLLELFQSIDDNDDDWVGEELPDVYAMIGPVAIPALANYLADSSHGLWARIGAVRSIDQIGQRHPGAQAECAAVLARALERFDLRETELNAYLISDLCDLGSMDYLSLIERAFASKRVDESVRGDWEDIQIELGLIKERTHPPARTQLDETRDKFISIIDGLVSEKKQPSRQAIDRTDDVISRMYLSGELKLPESQKTKSKKKSK